MLLAVSFTACFRTEHIYALRLPTHGFGRADFHASAWAGTIGLDVFAYPGDVDRTVAAGCNALIRDGATLVRDAVDVLEGLGLTASVGSGRSASGASEHPPTPPVENPLQRAILEALAIAPRRVDDLLRLTQAGAGEILAATVQLEIAGEIERRDGAMLALVQPARLK
ncbi:MAG: hypothetical protein M3N13_01965 [Candidatus Eremiobacteraeota bacterium]|nr:hypothetical protein [Candidatus Eremiobacteraeota bacterium]